MQVEFKHVLILIFFLLPVSGCSPAQPQSQISTSLPSTAPRRPLATAGPTSTAQVGQQIIVVGRLFTVSVDANQPAAASADTTKYYLDVANGQIIRLVIQSPVAPGVLGKRVTITGRVSQVGDPSLPENPAQVSVEVSTIQLAQ